MTPLTTSPLTIAGRCAACARGAILRCEHGLPRLHMPAARRRGRDLARGARAGRGHLVLCAHGGSQCGLGQRPAHFEDRCRLQLTFTALRYVHVVYLNCWCCHHGPRVCSIHEFTFALLNPGSLQRQKVKERAHGRQRPGKSLLPLR